MKHILIMVIAAAIAGFSGYSLGINKGSSDDTSEPLEGKVMGKRFSSETIIQIDAPGTISEAPKQDSVKTRQLMQTQLALMGSEKTIRRAIDDYDLVKRFGVNKEDLFKEIAESIEVSQGKGIDLISLVVHADSELKAQQIAYAITVTYGKRHREGIEKRRKEAIVAFKEKRIKQEKLVEEQRKKVESLSKKLGIPYGDKPEKGEGGAVESKLSPKMVTKLGVVSEGYGRETAILDAIKQAEFSELFGENLEMDSIVFHQYGWTSEVAKTMTLVE